MTEGKLVFVPKGYRVVPEYPTDEMVDTYNCSSSYRGITESYQDMISKSPPIDTPPVLRWELNINTWELYYFDAVIAIADNHGWNSMTKGSGMIRDNPQEARRAAEKALGFPDWLVVDEV